MEFLQKNRIKSDPHCAKVAYDCLSLLTWMVLRRHCMPMSNDG